MQLSRLDRQVILLETGSTQVVRNMAADQLGDLAKQHPEDTLSLLSRVYPFLMAKKWETRITTARAVGGIVSHSPSWDPNEDDEDDVVKPEETDAGANGTTEAGETAKVKLEHEIRLKLEEVDKTDEWRSLQDDSNLFSLASWNLNEILKSGKTLLAASVEDYSAALQLAQSDQASFRR